MTDNDIKTICEKIDSLHTKILKSKFAESVTESEIISLMLAGTILNRQQKEIERLHPYNLHYGNLRMELAREIIDRLKEYLIKPEFPWDDYYVTESVINHLLKEMEEENEQNY